MRLRARNLYTILLLARNAVTIHLSGELVFCAILIRGLMFDFIIGLIYRANINIYVPSKAKRSNMKSQSSEQNY